MRVNCEGEMGCVEVIVRVCGGDSEGELREIWGGEL